jgi:hypothetical protein
MIEYQPIEMMFSGEVIEQRDFVQKECNILQTLIDSETTNAGTSFLCCSNKRKLVITDDIFRRKRKLRRVINDDNDSDDDVDE